MQRPERLQRIWRSRTGLFTFTVVAGFGVGWMTANVTSRAGSNLWAVGVLVSTLIVVLVILRPVLAALIVLSFAFINSSLMPVLVEVAEFTVRPIDVAFGLLTLAILIKALWSRRLPSLHPLIKLFGPLLPFLLYVGLSLGFVWLHVPWFFLASLASYLRLMETVFLGFLLYLALDNERDLAFLHKGLFAMAVATLLIGAWEGLPGVMTGIVAERRYGGVLSVNTFGLVSGLLILYGMTMRGKGKAWLILLGVGAIGLILSRSASSILATSGTLGLFLASFRKFRKPNFRAAWQALMGIVAAMLAGFAIWTLRQADVHGLLAVSGGSFAQRLMIAYAAIKILGEHPLFGTGWRASSTNVFIGNPRLNADLMEVFPNLPSHYFFLHQTTSLHNMYFQLLAELGITGFLLFTYGCFLTGRSVRRFMKNIPDYTRYRAWARFHGLTLIYLLIWWNTNALYGGQTESILAFGSLAMVAAIWRIAARRLRSIGECIAQERRPT